MRGDQPSRRVTARIIARFAGLVPCALCRCDIFAPNVGKGAEAEPRWDGLGLIRQLLGLKGAPSLSADRRIRLTSETTMDEAWSAARPSVPDWEPPI